MMVILSFKQILILTFGHLTFGPNIFCEPLVYFFLMSILQQHLGIL